MQEGEREKEQKPQYPEHDDNGPQLEDNKQIQEEGVEKLQERKENSPYFSKKSHRFDHLTEVVQKQNTLPSINIMSKSRADSTATEQYFLTNSKLYKNKHLQYLYKSFCKQMYKGGERRTFDQISQSGDKMPLTKWMIFCKEFQVTKKLSPKETINIFKKATNYYSEMTYLTFIKGLQLAKARGNIQEKQMVKDMLHVNNHYDARDKLGNLKVHFNGPKINCFEESLYTNTEKIVRPRKEYKNEIILHQGKASEHLERQIREKKFLREEKKQQRMNQYLNNYSQVSHKAYFSYQKKEKEKIEETEDKKNKTIFKKRQKSDLSEKMKEKNSLTHSMKDKNSESENTKLSHSMLEKKLQSPIKDIGVDEEEKIIEVKEWEKESDTQSDDILRQHYENEKQSRKTTVVNKLDGGKEYEEEEEDRQTTMMITQYR